MASKAFGGMIVGMLIKLADNIVKTLASAVSVVSTLASYLFLDDVRLETQFVVRTSWVVILATVTYARSVV